MQKLIITLSTFCILFCCCAGVTSVDIEEDLHIATPTIEPSIQNTPVEVIQPLPEPQPKYYVSYKPDITVGVHDYYNAIVHGNKATIDNVEIKVVSNDNIIILYFDSLEDIHIPLTDLDCNNIIDVYINVRPDSIYASTSIDTYHMSLTVSLENETLVVNSNVDKIIIDFIYDTTEIVYPLTEVERHLLSSLLAHEYGYKNAEEGQRAVVSVVFNRLDYYGGTLHDIIYAKNQFTPARLIDPETGLSEYKNIFDYYSHCISTVDYVSAYGVTIPRSVLYFRADYYFNWDSVTSYKNIGSTYFSGLTKLINRYDEWHHYE